MNPYLLDLISGYWVKDQWFKEDCPNCIGSGGPPQTVYFIHNEKLKNKNGRLDLNNYLQIIDSLTIQKSKNKR